MARSGKGIVIGIVVAVVFVVVSAAGLMMFARGRSRISVQSGTVARKSLSSIVSASGEIKPKRYVNIAANVSGRITALYVQEGERVKKGQLLARIDAARFEAQNDQSQAAVAASEADLTRARADLEASRLNHDRTKRMHADHLVSEQVLDQARADLEMKSAGVEASRGRVAQVRAQLVSTRDDLEKTVVVAPMDGTVTSLSKEVGETVIGAQSFQPTVIMIVGDLAVMEAEVLVDETDIQSLALAQTAEVRVDAFEKALIKGKVTEIGSGAIARGGATGGQVAASQAKDFKVTVTLEDPPPGLRPGLNATADITTATRDNAIAVPLQAVVVRSLNEAGKPVEAGVVLAADEEPKLQTTAKGPPRRKAEEKEGVFVVAGGKAVFRPVTTGIVGETDIEIVEGIAEGEEIVTGSYRTLRTLKHDAKIRANKKKPEGRS